MFKNLFDLGYVRTPVEAFGFYIVYLIFVVIGSGIVGGIVGAMFSHGAYQVGLGVGNAVAVVLCLAVSVMILRAKRLMGNPALLVVAVVSALAALYAGGLLGMIPAAYLTTRTSDVQEG